LSAAKGCCRASAPLEIQTLSDVLEIDSGYGHDFRPAGFPGGEPHGPERHREFVGQELQECLVGRAVDRRGGEADTDSVAMQASSVRAAFG
jgi:hypothetical protein